jgi:hypothetical protein
VIKDLTIDMKTEGLTWWARKNWESQTMEG